MKYTATMGNTILIFIMAMTIIASQMSNVNSLLVIPPIMLCSLSMPSSSLLPSSSSRRESFRLAASNQQMGQGQNNKENHQNQHPSQRRQGTSNNINRRKVFQKIGCSATVAATTFFSPINIHKGNRDQNIIGIDGNSDKHYHFHPPVVNAMYENGPNVETPIITLSSGVTYQDLRVGTTTNTDVVDSSSLSSIQVVQNGSRVNIQWVLKRSNGYYIDSSSNDDGVPFIFTVGSSQTNTNINTNTNTNTNTNINNTNDNKNNSRPIVGLDEGIVGMTLGGIRRIVIPLPLAYVKGVEDGKPGPVPRGFGPKQRVRRVMEMSDDDIPGESIVLDVKVTRIQ